jgi:hypothetical protein
MEKDMKYAKFLGFMGRLLMLTFKKLSQKLR